MVDQNFRSNRSGAASGNGGFTFEIFVQKGYSEFELASVTQTLSVMNKIRGETSFTWRFVSDKPGLVRSENGMLVRAEPSVPDHLFADWMIVIGSHNPDVETWIRRARAMHQRGLTAVFLSGAATAYIKATNVDAGAITTHWRDAIVLHETGYYPNLTNRFSELSGNVITSAGAGSTIELVIGLISEHLAPDEIAEFANILLISKIRGNKAEQPCLISDKSDLFDQRISQVLSAMESTIDEPITMESLAIKVRLSTRQIERMFKTAFDTSPALYYRRLRLRRAHLLLHESQMSLVDIANATGFGSRCTFSTSFRREFGVLPSEIRTAKKNKLLNFS